MTRIEEDGANGNGGAMGGVIHPIQRGTIKDWDAMEDLWRYVFYTSLGWEPGNEGQLLIAEPLLTPKVSRERMVQTMFETFNVSGLYAMEQAVLSLYAVGRITGVAIDVGHGKIDIAPVWEGAIQHNAVKHFELAGQDLTDLLAKELAKSQPHVKLDLATVEMLKEKYATVSEDSSAYAATVEACPKIEHTLPDGQVISIGRERYAVGEALLRPSILGIQEDGLAEQLLRSVSMCYPSENQRQLIENIVLCGGTSAMAGLDARFQKEAVLVANPSVRPSLIKPPEYMPDNTLNNSAWMGGAILAKVVFPQNSTSPKPSMMRLAPQLFIGSAFDMNTVLSSGQFATKPSRLFLAKTITMLVFRCHLRLHGKPLMVKPVELSATQKSWRGVTVRHHGHHPHSRQHSHHHSQMVHTCCPFYNG